MATVNFWTMDEFPLMVMGDDEVCKYYLGEEDENGEPYEEYTDDDISFSWHLFQDESFCHDELEELNDELSWFNGKLKYGYYSGVQFYFDTKYISIKNWDDEDCEDEFGLTLEETKQMIEDEKKKILAFLEKMKDYGFRELLCLGVFSNGEGVYRWRDTINA